MTREEIIRLAEQSGNGEVRDAMKSHMFFIDELERFAALVAAAEREACAKLIDEQDSYGDPVYCWFKHLAAEIRARGKE